MSNKSSSSMRPPKHRISLKRSSRGGDLPPSSSFSGAALSGSISASHQRKSHGSASHLSNEHHTNRGTAPGQDAQGGGYLHHRYSADHVEQISEEIFQSTSDSGFGSRKRASRASPLRSPLQSPSLIVDYSIHTSIRFSSNTSFRWLIEQPVNTLSQPRPSSSLSSSPSAPSQRSLAQSRSQSPPAVCVCQQCGCFSISPKSSPAVPPHTVAPVSSLPFPLRRTLGQQVSQLITHATTTYIFPPYRSIESYISTHSFFSSAAASSPRSSQRSRNSRDAGYHSRSMIYPSNHPGSKQHAEDVAEANRRLAISKQQQRVGVGYAQLKTDRLLIQLPSVSWPQQWSRALQSLWTNILVDDAPPSSSTIDSSPSSPPWSAHTLQTHGSNGFYVIVPHDTHGMTQPTNIHVLRMPCRDVLHAHTTMSSPSQLSQGSQHTATLSSTDDHSTMECSCPTCVQIYITTPSASLISQLLTARIPLYPLAASAHGISNLVDPTPNVHTAAYFLDSKAAMGPSSSSLLGVSKAGYYTSGVITPPQHGVYNHPTTSPEPENLAKLPAIDPPALSVITGYAACQAFINMLLEYFPNEMLTASTNALAVGQGGPSTSSSSAATALLHGGGGGSGGGIGSGGVPTRTLLGLPILLSHAPFVGSTPSPLSYYVDSDAALLKGPDIHPITEASAQGDAASTSSSRLLKGRSDQATEPQDQHHVTVHGWLPPTTFLSLFAILSVYCRHVLQCTFISRIKSSSLFNSIALVASYHKPSLPTMAIAKSEGGVSPAGGTPAFTASNTWVDFTQTHPLCHDVEFLHSITSLQQRAYRILSSPEMASPSRSHPFGNPVLGIYQKHGLFLFAQGIQECMEYISSMGAPYSYLASQLTPPQLGTHYHYLNCPVDQSVSRPSPDPHASSVATATVTATATAMVATTPVELHSAEGSSSFQPFTSISRPTPLSTFLYNNFMYIASQSHPQLELPATQAAQSQQSAASAAPDDSSTNKHERTVFRAIHPSIRFPLFLPYLWDWASTYTLFQRSLVMLYVYRQAQSDTKLRHTLSHSLPNIKGPDRKGVGRGKKPALGGVKHSSSLPGDDIADTPCDSPVPYDCMVDLLRLSDEYQRSGVSEKDLVGTPLMTSLQHQAVVRSYQMLLYTTLHQGYGVNKITTSRFQSLFPSKGKKKKLQTHPSGQSSPTEDYAYLISIAPYVESCFSMLSVLEHV